MGMTFHEAALACVEHRLYVPELHINTVAKAIYDAIADEALVAKVLYMVNMLHSENVPWVECIVAAMASQGV